MAPPITQALDPPTTPVPPLRDGERLSRDEFERRYEAMGEDVRAELLDGVVYLMPAAVSDDHGFPHFNLIGVLSYYAHLTPGIVGCDNGSVRLGPINEPQPDVLLRILYSHGGQSYRATDGILVGGPELLAEIAVSSVYHDLRVKLPIYQRHQVQEYLVWRIRDQALDWLVLRGGQYAPLAPDGQGVVRSLTFPGLWLDVAALVRSDFRRTYEVLNQGLASPEHAAFVARLAAAQPTGPLQPGERP